MFDWIGLFCHQLPGRSLHCDGDVFPLCFRCCGTAIGLFTGFLLLLVDGRGIRRRLPALGPALVVGMLTTPWLIDGWGNFLGLWNTPGWARSLTGVGGGVGLPLLILPLLQPLDLDATRNLPPSVDGIVGYGAAVAAASGFVVGLNWAPGVMLFQVAKVLCAVGEAAFALTLALVVWMTLAERFRRRPARAQASAASVS